MKIIRKKPVIHFHGKELMAKEIKARRKKGEIVNVIPWIRENADKVNLPYGTLYKYIYGKRPTHNNQDKLVEIFGKKAFTFTWEDIED